MPANTNAVKILGGCLLGVFVLVGIWILIPKLFVQHVTGPCGDPPPQMGATLGLSASFVSSNYSKLIKGEIKTDPHLLTLASQAALDDSVKSYLRCLAINRDHFTPEQAVYFDLLSAFLSTHPSPDQFIKWQDGHPFPKADSSKTPQESTIDRLQDDSTKLKAIYERMKSETNQQARSLAQHQVESSGSALAEEMLNVPDSSLKPIFQLQKYEYAVSALYMAAYAAFETDKTTARDLSGQAIKYADEALVRIDKLRQSMQAGDEASVKDYHWLIGDHAPERVRWFRAIALAINWGAKGSHSPAEVKSDWNLIPQPYKDEYPASSNILLAKALEQSTQSAEAK